VARYTFTTRSDAPPDVVFDLWTNLQRMHEWVGGVTGVTDISGPITRVGTTYTVRFGPMKSPTRVLEADRPTRFTTKFGSRLLAGHNSTVFEPDGRGTRITETFETEGLVAGIMARLFAAGSYRGSFRGELEAFARLAEQEAPPDVGRATG
jgi:hypothetical protein